MPIGIIASFFLFLITVGILFLSGVLGLSSQDPLRCVRYQTSLDHYQVVRQLGFVTVREPVFKEECVDGLELKPNEKASDYHQYP